MKRVLSALSALVGVGLVLAAGAVLADGSNADVEPARASTSEAQPVAAVDSGEVQVRDPLLVVNKDGSTAVGAYVQNGKDVEVALMGVSIWVDRQPVRVNATEMWLPVPAGEQAQVGAASDAGGFVIPHGIEEATRADVEFRFDDGTCVLAQVTAVARMNTHRLTYPKSNRTIGPSTAGDLPSRSTACDGEKGSKAEDELANDVSSRAEESTRRHELRVTIRDTPAPNDPDAADAYETKPGGGCSAIVWGEDSEQLGELVVSAPDGKDEQEMLETFELPASARLLPDGTCEATLTINVRYASQYVLGVGIMGRGILPENAPKPPVVITQGESQSVVVVK